MLGASAMVFINLYKRRGSQKLTGLSVSTKMYGACNVGVYGVGTNIRGELNKPNQADPELRMVECCSRMYGGESGALIGTAAS